MHILGAVRMSSFLIPWLFGCASIPLTIAAFFAGIRLPAYMLLSYYSFRLIFPAKYWPLYREMINLKKTPYCNSQVIVFDEGAAVPKRDSRVMLATCPHGILTIGWATLVGSDEFCDSAIRWLIADSLTIVPFMADCCAWVGARGCKKDTMQTLMQKGRNIALLPGGFEEASLYKRHRHKVYLKERKGFIKYALQYGYHVMPVYFFGEEKTYWEMNIAPTSWRLWLNKFKIPATMFVGRYMFFMPDNDIDITVVVGKALKFPHLSEPTSHDVDKYHGEYMQALTDLFNRHKEKYADSDSVLEIY